MYEEYSISGPYLREDGRKHILLRKDGRKKTVSYPKYLLENYLKKYLNDNEVVHHIDGDFSNDSVDNLEVLDRAEHAKLHAKPAEVFKFTCSWCGSRATQLAKDVRHNRNQGKKGPFCGKSCAGKYGRAKQLGRI